MADLNLLMWQYTPTSQTGTGLRERIGPVDRQLVMLIPTMVGESTTEKLLFSRRWYRRYNFHNLDIIWEMSGYCLEEHGNISTAKQPYGEYTPCRVRKPSRAIAESW